jgi:hypothetical protein
VPKMCRLFAPGHKADPIYVNPMTVRYVRPASAVQSVIYFEDDESISVPVPLEEVIAALDKAMNENMR